MEKKISQYRIWYKDGTTEVIEVPHSNPTEDELYDTLVYNCKGHWEQIEDWERLK